MIRPVVVRVALNRRQRGNDRLSVSLELPIIGDQSVHDFGCDITHEVFRRITESVPSANTIREAGERLYAGLCTNPYVHQALNQARQATTVERYPLLLELRADDTVEALPWETLYVSDPGFFGLDLRWSMGRKVDSSESRPCEGVLHGVLRIAVVLSCLGISAREEWLRLRAAVEEQSFFDVEMLLFVGEPDLVDELVGDCPGWARVVGIPASADALAEMLRQKAREGFVPQVLHFFCHGSNDGGAHLEIATPSDWERDATQSSLTLDPSQVRDLTDVTDRPWLVVLNSCLGAAPLTDDSGAASADESRARQRAATHSLARRLVREGGFPAVIGMREPIDTSDATVFSSTLYPALLSALSVLPTDEATQLDWSSLLVRPRRRLAEQGGGVFATAAGDRKQWTLPVLYLRSQVLLIKRDPPGRPPAVDGTDRRGPADESAAPGVPVPSPATTPSHGDAGAETAPAGTVMPGTTPSAPAPIPGTAAATSTLDLLRDVLASLGSDAPHAFRADLEAQVARLERGDR